MTMMLCSRLGDLLFGESCSRELVEVVRDRSLRSLTVACRGHIFRRCLSYGIVAGASVVRLPQIAKVVAARDARGLSLLGALLEATAATISFAYSHKAGRSWELYGETAFVALQGLVLMVLIGLFGSGTKRPRSQPVLLSAALALYVSFCTALLLPGYLTMQHLQYLQMATIPMATVARLPAIWTVLRTRSAGQLSLLSLALGTAGHFARLYIAVKGARDDHILLVGAASTAVVSLLLLVLALVFAAPSKCRAHKLKVKRN